jgi:hypothetical protein
MGMGGKAKLRDRHDRQRAKKRRDKSAAAGRGAERKAAKKK